MSNNEELRTRSCIPCRGGALPLGAVQAEALLAQLSGWTLEDDAHRIARRFTFRTFAAAYAFVTRVAKLAEAEGHHPDITFGWGYADISLQTHVIKGLHENDFILAAKIDAAATDC